MTALTDKEAPVRLAAVRALAATRRPEVEALLRYKTLLGDEDLQVVSDALESLLVIAPGRSLPLAKRLLDSSDEAVAEAAALALGGSRCEEAFELLTSRLGDFDFHLPLTQTMLLALSMLRREEPMAFLIDLAERAPRRRAENVIKALAIHRYDPKIRERLEKALSKRKDKKLLLALCASEFGDNSRNGILGGDWDYLRMSWERERRLQRQRHSSRRHEGTTPPVERRRSGGRLEAVLMSCSNWDASLILCSQQSRFDVVLDLEKNHRQGDALIRFGESR